MGRKKFQLFKKTIKAPLYFKEHQLEVDKMDKYCADLCGMSVKWWLKEMQKEHFADVIKGIADEKEWTDTERKKVERLTGIASIFKVYCSGKYQYDNINNEWGRADFIQYNKDTDELELKWLKEKLKRTAKKIFISDKDKEPSFLKRGIKKVKEEVLDKKDAK